jgi:peptide deformylase
MAVRRIFDSSNEVLRGQAQPVGMINSAILTLLDDMVETMFEAKGVGLAAPQVGIAKQLIVVDAGEGEVLQLLNPRITAAEGNCVDVEGCLSIPGVFGEVNRAEKVTVIALEKEGREVRLDAEGLLARILQHEIDHLHGTLFIDRADRLVDPDDVKKRGQEG